MFHENKRIAPRIYVIGDESVGLALRLRLKLQKFSTWLWYQFLGGKPFDMTFMNYGYVRSGACGEALELDSGDEHNRDSIELYHRVVEAVELCGKDVLEVGSGFGGGSAFVRKYLHPRSMTGVDFANKAVAFCRRHYAGEGISFMKGDAQNLPFPAESFDAVINVESCHCYISVDRFLEHIFRVLRPGGYLLLADFRPKVCVAAFREELGRCGLWMIEEENITPNVLRALEANSERNREWIEEKVPARFCPTISNLQLSKVAPFSKPFAPENGNISAS